MADISKYTAEDIKVLETYDIVLSDVRGVGKIFQSKFEVIGHEI